MKVNTRRQIVLAAAFLSIGLGFQGVQAQAVDFPTKPIRIIVPVATGGLADYYSRLIAKQLTAAWGQPVIVENRPSAGGIVAADFVSKSAADGHTLLMGYLPSNAVSPALFKNLPYDAETDFTPILLVAEAEGLLVVPSSLSVKNVSELVYLARTSSPTLTYASAGLGTASHLAGELFKSVAGIDMVHVPYKGNAPALVDLLGGQTQLMFATMPTVLPHVRSGKLRGLAVIGESRSASMPGAPTVKESLPDFSVNNWIGLFARAGTPDSVVKKINAEVSKMMATPEVRQRMQSEGERFTANTPEEFARFVRSEQTKWGGLIRKLGIKAD